MRIARLSLLLVIGSLSLASPAVAADGAWDRAWGKDVVAGNTETGFEVCVVAAQCKAGASTPGEIVITPKDVAVANNGDVYVADGAARVVVFDALGNFKRMWGRNVVSGGPTTGYEICTVAAQCKAGEFPPGRPGEGFTLPETIAIDGSGNVYVTDGASRVQKFDASGNFLFSFGKNVDSGGGSGFEVCSVAPACQTGEQGDLGGELTADPIVAASASGDVYVTETLTWRVQKFSSSGAWQRTWGRDVNGADGDTGAETCLVAAQCKAGRRRLRGGRVQQHGGTRDRRGRQRLRRRDEHQQPRPGVRRERDVHQHLGLDRHDRGPVHEPVGRRGRP